MIEPVGMNETEKLPLANNVERWDLFAVSMNEQDKIKEALETGYEPFAVTNQMKPAPASAIEVPGQAAPRGMVMDTLIWMKRKSTFSFGTETEQ